MSEDAATSTQCGDILSCAFWLSIAMMYRKFLCKHYAVIYTLVNWTRQYVLGHCFSEIRTRDLDPQIPLVESFIIQLIWSQFDFYFMVSWSIYISWKQGCLLGYPQQDAPPRRVSWGSSWWILSNWRVISNCACPKRGRDLKQFWWFLFDRLMSSNCELCLIDHFCQTLFTMSLQNLYFTYCYIHVCNLCRYFLCAFDTK